MIRFPGPTTSTICPGGHLATNISFLCSLYRSLIAQISTWDYKSEIINIVWRTRQGCRFSPLLFIAIETFAIALCTDFIINIESGNRAHKCAWFADDYLPTYRSPKLAFSPEILQADPWTISKLGQVRKH